MQKTQEREINEEINDGCGCGCFRRYDERLYLW
jgi:hypothetical protein